VELLDRGEPLSLDHNLVDLGFSWFVATANRMENARTASYSGRVRLIGSVHRRSEHPQR
jgi:hypothetical protein